MEEIKFYTAKWNDQKLIKITLAEKDYNSRIEYSTTTDDIYHDIGYISKRTKKGFYYVDALLNENYFPWSRLIPV